MIPSECWGAVIVWITLNLTIHSTASGTATACDSSMAVVIPYTSSGTYRDYKPKLAAMSVVTLNLSINPSLTITDLGADTINLCWSLIL